MANDAKGKGKELAEAVLKPGDPGFDPAWVEEAPGLSEGETVHYDFEGDPEPMTLEPGYWYRGVLGPVFDGNYGPARVLFRATYGRGKTQLNSGCTFWVPSQAALMDNVLKYPLGSEVTMQCAGHRDLKNGKTYTMWKVALNSVPKKVTATIAAPAPAGDDDMPF